MQYIDRIPVQLTSSSKSTNDTTLFFSQKIDLERMYWSGYSWMNTNHEDLCKFMQIHKNEEKFLTSLLCKMHGRDHLQEERQKRHQKRPKVCNKQETALFVLMNCMCVSKVDKYWTIYTTVPNRDKSLVYNLEQFKTRPVN